MSITRENVLFGHQKNTTVMEFFKTDKTTRQLMTEDDIFEKKKMFARLDKEHGDKTTYYEKDGIVFFTVELSTENGFRLIHNLTPHSSMSGGKLWKFGFVNEANEIVELAGGHFIAKGRNEARSVFNIHRGKYPTLFAEKN